MTDVQSSSRITKVEHEYYPTGIKLRDGYIVIVHEALNCHGIKESDIESW